MKLEASVKRAIYGWSVASVLALTAIGSLYASANSGRRRAPTPDGMVFRVKQPEDPHVFDRFIVDVASVDPPSIVVVESRKPGGVSTKYGYPSGEVLAVTRLTSVFSPGPSPRFDFDGDGTVDEIECERSGLVRVVSGAGGAVLFEQRDELEYEDYDRAFALGDLDSDGCSELALVHPRQDRSDYDFVIWDGLLGVNSWVTVVSGARARGR